MSEENGVAIEGDEQPKVEEGQIGVMIGVHPLTQEFTVILAVGGTQVPLDPNQASQIAGMLQQNASSVLVFNQLRNMGLFGQQPGSAEKRLFVPR